MRERESQNNVSFLVHVHVLFIFLFIFFLSKLLIVKKISEQHDASLNTRAISLNFHATFSTQISIGSSNSIKFSYHIKQKAKQYTDQSYSVCVRRVTGNQTREKFVYQERTKTF